MHALALVAVLVGLVWFAFGHTAARIFTGTLMALGAVAGIALLLIAWNDIQRQTAQPKYVRMYNERGAQ